MMLAREGFHLAFFECHSLGEAFTLLQKSESHCHVETLPTHMGCLLILVYENQFQSFDNELFKNSAFKKWIKNISKNLIEAWQGVLNPALKKSLFVFETSSPAEGFLAAQRLELAEKNVFEIRFLRGAVTKCFVLATEFSEEAVEKSEKNKKIDFSDLEGQLTVIENPSTSLKDFFSFTVS